jgi:hypothetical protein
MRQLGIARVGRRLRKRPVRRTAPAGGWLSDADAPATERSAEAPRDTTDRFADQAQLGINELLAADLTCQERGALADGRLIRTGGVAN